MRIEQLEVKNFKGFEHQLFRFSPQFNVLKGETGSGKTTILNALAVGVGALLQGFEGISSRIIQPSDVRQIGYQAEHVLKLEPKSPTVVSCRGEVDDLGVISWECELSQMESQTSYEKAQALTDKGKQLQDRIRTDDNSLVLPLLSYYGTGWLWAQKTKEAENTQPNSRLSGYEECLEQPFNEPQFQHWFKTMETAALEQPVAMNKLEGLRRAVRNCVEGCESIYFDLQHDTPIAILADEQFLPIHLLSEGQRIILAMVADIAYKIISLNPQLEGSATLETPGIVLIDEIDLCLSTDWQRKIVYKLRNTFPKIQFIVTTSSSLITQSLPPTELIYLSEDETQVKAERVFY